MEYFWRGEKSKKIDRALPIERVTTVNIFHRRQLFDSPSSFPYKPTRVQSSIGLFSISLNTN
jgi:hypothetical protein